jgi:hypothetical protein
MRAIIGLIAPVLLLVACAAGSGTPSPVPPTSRPTATLGAVQKTADAARGFQRATQVIVQDAACGEIEALYTEHGQTFDRAAALRDPESAIIERRIMLWGNAKPGLGFTSPDREERYRQTLYTCLGIAR